MKKVNKSSKKIAEKYKSIVRDFVNDLTEDTKTTSYISKECLLNFCADWVSNFDDKYYDPEAECNPFCYMSSELCWLTAKQIKNKKRCHIRNRELVQQLNDEMLRVIKRGDFERE